MTADGVISFLGVVLVGGVFVAFGGALLYLCALGSLWAFEELRSTWRKVFPPRAALSAEHQAAEQALAVARARLEAIGYAHGSRYFTHDASCRIYSVMRCPRSLEGHDAGRCTCAELPS